MTSMKFLSLAIQTLRWRWKLRADRQTSRTPPPPYFLVRKTWLVTRSLLKTFSFTDLHVYYFISVKIDQMINCVNVEVNSRNINCMSIECFRWQWLKNGERIATSDTTIKENQLIITKQQQQQNRRREDQKSHPTCSIWTNNKNYPI